MGKVFTQIAPQYRGQILCLEVDISDQANNELLDKYKILSIPTSIFITKGGKVDAKIVGFLKKDEVKQRLNLLEGK